MRGVFGLIGLLAVVAIVGLVAAQQWRAARDGAAAAGAASVPAAGNVRERSQALQEQVGSEVAGRLQQSAERRGDDAAK